MAVEDKYTDSNITGNEVDKLLTALASATGKLYVAAATFEVAAADDDGSKYRIFKNMDANLVPIAILVGNDAITGSTDWDVGFYDVDLGAVVDKDVLADGIDLSSAHTLSHLSALSGMVTVDVANVGKRIFELLGATVSNKKEAYDLVLTANTVGSAAGTVSVIGLFAQG